MLMEWLDIQQDIALADEDLRRVLSKGKSAPGRRVRKSIRELRKKLQTLSKRLIAFDRAKTLARKDAKTKDSNGISKK